MTLDRIAVTQTTDENTYRSPLSPLRLLPSRFAGCTAGMTVSEVRVLFALAIRPEVVSRAGGMPN
jgi:2-aminoadipate transaminase